MKNELLTKSIILPSGEISKDKINLVVGAIIQPFVEMIWVTIGGDMEIINRLTNILVTINNPTDRVKLFKIIKLFYGLMGLPFQRKPSLWTQILTFWNTSSFLSWQTLEKLCKIRKLGRG